MAVIAVNGVEIGEREIAIEMQHHPAPTPEEARAMAVEALVVRELLLQAAAGRGIVGAPQRDVAGREETREEATIRDLLEQTIDVPQVEEEACRRYYDSHGGLLRSPDLFEASHILLAAFPTDHDARHRAEDEARDIIGQLQSQPSLFAEIARKRSACPSAANGGNLGQIARGQTVPEFETFLLALEEGQLCPVPVKTRFGVHVLRLDRRIEGRPLAYEAVRDRIAEYLHEARWRHAVAAFIGELVAHARIEGIDLAAARPPLTR